MRKIPLSIENQKSFRENGLMQFSYAFFKRSEQWKHSIISMRDSNALVCAAGIMAFPGTLKVLALIPCPAIGGSFQFSKHKENVCLNKKEASSVEKPCKIFYLLMVFSFDIQMSPLWGSRCLGHIFTWWCWRWERALKGLLAKLVSEFRSSVCTLNITPCSLKSQREVKLTIVK